MIRVQHRWVFRSTVDAHFLKEVVLFSRLADQIAHCAGPENIHTPATEAIGISWGVGGSVRPKY